LTFDGNDAGTGSCFEIPGDEDADIILAAQSSIPGGVGGDAVEAGDVDVEKLGEGVSGVVGVAM